MRFTQYELRPRVARNMKTHLKYIKNLAATRSPCANRPLLIFLLLLLASFASLHQNGEPKTQQDSFSTISQRRKMNQNNMSFSVRRKGHDFSPNGVCLCRESIVCIFHFEGERGWDPSEGQHSQFKLCPMMRVDLGQDLTPVICHSLLRVTESLLMMVECIGRLPLLPMTI